MKALLEHGLKSELPNEKKKKKKEQQMVPSSVTNYSNQELYELIIGNNLFSIPFLPSVLSAKKKKFA